MSSFHYFASSFAYWGTSEKMEDAIKKAVCKGAAVQVYYVPLSDDASYEINRYQPVVDGVRLVRVVKADIKNGRLKILSEEDPKEYFREMTGDFIVGQYMGEDCLLLAEHCREKRA